jgi:hypothetical protein
MREPLKLTLDDSLKADQLAARLAAEARAHGVPSPIAFVWGDPASVPDGARPAEIRSGNAELRGWLVGRAHEVDMGKLAPSIHDVVMVQCEREHLVASYPPDQRRARLDVDRTDPQRRIDERFAFVSTEPGDVSDDARASEVLALLSRLPSHARYAVMGLGE